MKEGAGPCMVADFHGAEGVMQRVQLYKMPMLWCVNLFVLKLYKFDEMCRHHRGLWHGQCGLRCDQRVTACLHLPAIRPRSEPP